MTVDAWTTLWVSLLWLSMSAFGLTAIYVLGGYVQGLRKLG